MSKKTEPAKPSTQDPPRCFRCDGTGKLCEVCGETESVCEGDEGDHDYVEGPCEDCKGTGK